MLAKGETLWLEKRQVQNYNSYGQRSVRICTASMHLHVTQMRAWLACAARVGFHAGLGAFKEATHEVSVGYSGTAQPGEEKLTTRLFV